MSPVISQAYYYRLDVYYSRDWPSANNQAWTEMKILNNDDGSIHYTTLKILFQRSKFILKLKTAYTAA